MKKQFSFALFAAALVADGARLPDALGKALFIENDAALKPGAWCGDFAAVKPG